MRPTFSLRLGQLSCTEDSPTGGPVSIVVDREIDVPVDAAWIRLADRSDIAVADSVTVDIGVDRTPTRVFTGEVVQVEAGLDTCLVVATGTLRALVDLRAATVWSNASIGSITRDLAGQAGVPVGTIDEGPTLPRFAIDPRRSAHAQLRALVESFGLELYADRHGALVLKGVPDASPGGFGAVGGVVAGAKGMPGGGAGSLGYGANVIDARGELRAAAWESVVVGGQSPASTRGQSTADWLTTDDQVARGESGSGARRAVSVASVARTKDLARAVADGIRVRGGRSAHVVAVTIAGGRAELDLGDDVSLPSMPDAILGGSGRVRALRHRLDAVNGFTTTITAALAGAAGGGGYLP
jgi:hypothetical protein